jgi:hypothetical protein
MAGQGRVSDLRLLLRLASPNRPAGGAVLVNNGGQELQVWRPGSSLGDRILSFETAGPSGVAVIARAPLVYTRDVPTGHGVPAGGEYAIAFDLRDGTWEPDVAPDATALTAVLEILESPEARREGIWAGRLRSDPAPLG